MARGAAALIKDLKQRGMLDDTIVLWTTEFGRMPCSQGGKGRDHNPFVLHQLARRRRHQGGVTYGASDEWGYKPLDREHPTLGLRHPRHDAAPARHRPQAAHVRHNGIDRRLTDVHGHVIGSCWLEPTNTQRPTRARNRNHGDFERPVWLALCDRSPQSVNRGFPCGFFDDATLETILPRLV